ncbi:MAG TPA: hypothetical protein VHT00_13195 [Stellaceae bacterium]|nr:hypothetical protein [Stellaceae bacterium]
MLDRYIGVFALEVKSRNVPMPLLIGAATAATTLLSMAFGQINTGFEAFGVLLAAIVLMTLRQE